MLNQIEVCLKKVDASQRSTVKLRRAEFDLLKGLETVRDLVQELLRSGDRALLREIFGDCGRAARLSALLGAVQFSAMNEQDKRLSECRGVCTTLEEVLRKDLGLQEKLEEAQRRNSRVLLEARVSVILNPEHVAALQEQVEACPAPDEEEEEASEKSTEENVSDCEDSEDEAPPLPSATAEAAAEEGEAPPPARILFNDLDKNGDGVLDKKDVRQATRESKSLRKQLKMRSGREFTRFFRDADLNQDGVVDYEEFLQYLEMLQKRAEEVPPPVNDAQVQSIFDTFDRDKDGLVSLEELKWSYASIMLSVGKTVDRKRVNAWSKKNLKKYGGSEATGGLDSTQFKSLLTNSGVLLQAALEASRSKSSS